MTLALRPYQDAVVNHTIPALWKAGQRRVVLCSPVGSGKTVCDLALIQRCIEKDWAAVYIVAHTSELLKQPTSGLDLIGARWAFVRAGVPEDRQATVQVCSAATLVRRTVEAPPDRGGRPYRRCILIVDEGHRLRTRTHMQILAALRRAYDFVYVVIQTATPYRLDGRSLGPVADALVEAVTPRQLVALGWLTDPVVFSRPAVDPAALRSPGDPGNPDTALPGPMPTLPQASALCGDIVREWQRHSGGAPTILRAVNRAHARALAERFREAGVRADCIDGTMGDAQRGRLLGRLAIGGAASRHPLALDVLCSGGTIVEEGFDSAASHRYAVADRDLWDADGPAPYVPLGCLVDAAPTNSRGAWIQRLGRVTRVFGPAEVADFAVRGLRAVPKAGAVALCHSGNLERHGFLLQHEGFTLQGDRLGAAPLKLAADGSPACAYPQYKPPRVAECPRCFASAPAGAPCPACGHQAPLTARDLPSEDASSALVERRHDPQRDPVPATDEDREHYLRALWRKWRERNDAGQATKSGWVSVIYKQKFRSWPDNGMNRAVGRMYGWDGRS